MDGFPTAVILARLADVVTDPDVLFRFVRPTPARDGVQSADGVVNVLPQRRTYRMITESEIELFKCELLKRPLVLQPVSHVGVGCNRGGMSCGMCYKDEDWVLLINQTHPKILSRLQMGIDAAKAAIGRGDPFVLEYKFGTLLERIHNDLFDVYDDASHAEWDFAELVVKYPGKLVAPAKLNTLHPKSLLDQYMPKCKELLFDFSDVEIQEVRMANNNSICSMGKPNQAISEDEIRTLLPGWTVNEVSPLDNIGERIPATYSYAQAGRLYESFRKKNKRRTPTAGNRPAANSPRPEEVELAEIHLQSRDRFNYPAADSPGYGFNYPATVSPGDRFNYPATVSPGEGFNYPPPVSPGDRLNYLAPGSAGDRFNNRSPGSAETSLQTGDRFNYPAAGTAGDRFNNRSPGMAVNHLQSGDRLNYPSASVSVEVGPNGPNYYDSIRQSEFSSGKLDSIGMCESDRLHHRDSDRSQSTIASSGAADSGYAGHDSDGFGDAVNGYRKPHHVPDPYSNLGPSPANKMYENVHVNMAYEPDEDAEKEALKKHSEYVAKMLHSQEKERGSTVTSPRGRYDSPSSKSGYVEANVQVHSPRGNTLHAPHDRHAASGNGYGTERAQVHSPHRGNYMQDVQGGADVTNGPRAMPRRSKAGRSPVGVGMAGGSPGYGNGFHQTLETNQVSESFI